MTDQLTRVGNRRQLKAYNRKHHRMEWKGRARVDWAKSSPLRVGEGQRLKLISITVELARSFWQRRWVEEGRNENRRMRRASGGGALEGLVFDRHAAGRHRKCDAICIPKLAIKLGGDFRPRRWGRPM